MNLFFFKITWRNLTKRGVFSMINILGLSIGLAVVLLISLLIFNERSFDKSFKESRNIYRINSNMTAFMPGETHSRVGNAVGPAMKEAVPEVIAAVRTCRTDRVIKINDHPFRVKIIWADEDFFRLFDTPFLFGTPETALSRPNTIAISEEMAKKLFGTGNPVGETFLYNNREIMEVAAVYRDYPKNSSFWEYKMIAPITYYNNVHMGGSIQWGNIMFETFCLLPEKADTAQVGAKMRKVISDATAGMMPGGGGWWYYPSLQRLDEIHLHSAKLLGSYTSSQSDIEKVKMLSLLAVIILIVACINYMNLSTARAQKRSREIGISKTVGAKRYELITRLFFETGIFTLISFLTGFVLAWVLLPFFNILLCEQLQIGLAFRPLFLCISLLIWLVTTVFAASYPAIYLSGFPPLMAIRSSGLMPKSSHAVVRKILTVGQFAVSVVLIAWVLIIQTQIKFIDNKHLGYNSSNLIGLSLHSLPQDADLGALANDYRAESSVEMISRAAHFPFDAHGDALRRNADDQMGASIMHTSADPDYVDLMQMKMIAGRPLPESRPGDTIIQIILNRAAVDYLEMTPEEAIGKNVLIFSRAITQVCGVVENFNFESLHRPVSGFGIHNRNQSKSIILLRVAGGNLSEQLKTYEQIFKKHYPNELFEPKFADLELEKAYEGERRTSRVAIVFSMLAIFVACMGVFGLTAFMAEQRTKEIGIRKVLGASVMDIVRLFTNNYLRLLLISLVIAIPAAWWVGNQYLQNFAYRISISWWIFVAAGSITIVLTLLTVGWMAVKAAMKNPLEAIKSE